MKSKTLSSMVTVLVLSLFLVVHARAADPKGQPDAEMQANMAKVKEAGTPGAEHAVLNPMVGDWTVSSRHWMKRGAKPEKSTATSTLAWVLDGRFLKQKYKGDWAGQPFDGLGFLGYDKVKKEYVSVWMDSMSTGMSRSAGRYDTAARTIEDEGTFSCPVTGEKEMWFRSVWKIVNDNKLVFNMYTKDPEGKEFRSMELVYKRIK